MHNFDCFVKSTKGDILHMVEVVTENSIISSGNTFPKKIFIKDVYKVTYIGDDVCLYSEDYFDKDIRTHRFNFNKIRSIAITPIVSNRFIKKSEQNKMKINEFVSELKNNMLVKKDKNEQE